MKRSVVPLLIALSACESRKAELEVKFSGCERIDDGPVCIIGPGKSALLRLVVEGDDLSVTLDDEPIAHQRMKPSGGLEARIDRAGRLTIENDRARFILPIEDQGRARSEDLSSSISARALLRAGDFEGAVRLFDRTAARHAASGARSEAIRDLHAAAYALVSSGHQPEEAALRLDRAEFLLDGYAEGWSLQPYYRGLISRASGDHRRALDNFAAAKARFTELGLEEMVAGVEEAEAVTLQDLGRDQQARQILLRLAGATEASPCVRARRLNNMAWVGLIESDTQNRAPSSEVRAALEEARALYDLPACKDLPGRERLLLHAALAAVLSQDFAVAAELIGQTKSKAPGLEAELWREEILARIALGQGRSAAALEALDRSLLRARATLALDAVWRLETLRGRALEAIDRRAAISAYQRAEEVLDDGMLRLPIFEGRGSFLSDRSSSARGLSRLLLLQGKESEALCVLRRARSRAVLRAASGLRIHALDESRRRSWSRAFEGIKRLHAEIEGGWDLPSSERLVFEAKTRATMAQLRALSEQALAIAEQVAPPNSCADLRGPDRGELILFFHPLDGTNAIVFALDDRGLRVQRFDRALEGWLAPFDEELRRASRVRLLPSGSITKLPLHLAPWRGAPLWASRVVVYGLDLPAVAETKAKAMDAVVVADPTRSLSGARAEGEITAQLLAASGWKTRTLRGEEATLDAVLAAIESSTLLHYAGHAEGEQFSDRLMLHHGELRSQDVLLAARVPRSVVLSGCRTSDPAGPESDGAISLAEAFVLAGAQEVLAATEDLPDSSGAAIAAAIHTHAELDLAQQASAAIARDEQPQINWARLRVWVP